ncbi:dual specificity protein phosphatase 13-like isoform X2 [Synchiropus splendidus]|uniref:dual specificity protein phosphatase 13-like isoform X2 n=1 Tax=Synchiropus splendidus TaxID=270530 RepID=UPI00237DC8BC|nr:dual specificity protein phosphatase 13-like isoform X2 [Synchiropus splendidus]
MGAELLMVDMYFSVIHCVQTERQWIFLESTDAAVVCCITVSCHEKRANRCSWGQCNNAFPASGRKPKLYRTFHGEVQMFSESHQRVQLRRYKWKQAVPSGDEEEGFLAAKQGEFSQICAYICGGILAVVFLFASMSLRDPPYDPPSVSELLEFLLRDRRPTGHVNQVWPNLYIGNEVAARDKATLHSMRISHIVNAAHRPTGHCQATGFCVNTGPRFYRDMAVDYYGVEADDAIEFILSPFFYPTARYIRAALAQGGKVLVHCLMGVSRSATLVLAFLMIAEGLRLQEAVTAVRAHRDICPNPGFLQQLRSLDKTLERERRRGLLSHPQ